jgi:hypothetical protein
MRWALFEPVKGLPLPSDGLPGPWNSSFTRAVHELAEEPRHLLEIERRPLASLEECVEHFPNKTLDGMTRAVRVELLPALLEWTNDESGPGPHYSAASNEEYHINRFDRDQRREVRQQWLAIEDALVTLHASIRTADLFHLIAKGKALFTKSTLQDRNSFAYYLQACNDQKQLPAELSERLRRFAESVLPLAQVGFLKLKSYIHAFAHLPSRGAFSLKPPTIEALHSKRKAFVESLPGFEAPSESRRRFGGEPTHSDRLLHLFDKTVFQEFQFLRLTA